MERKVVTTVSHELVQELIESSGKELISIYLPLETKGADTLQNPIRYKNLLNELANQTSNREWLDQLRALEDDFEFWQEQNQGLAIFSTPQTVTFVQLPISVTEKASVSSRFHLLPLFPLLQQNSSFFVLKVVLNQMQLLLGSRYGQLSEVPIEGDIYTSIDEYLNSFDLTQELQFHTVSGGGSGGGRGNAIFHGHGDVTAEQKTQIRRFFDQYEKGISALLQENSLPVVLAGVDYLLPIFREAFSGSNLAKGEISQQPDSLSGDDLQEMAWACLEPDLLKDEQAERAMYQDLQGSKRVSPFLTDIIPLAVEGRIQSLFIRESAQEWGKYDPEKNEVHLHTEQQQNSEDLWERAAQEAFRTSAKVFIIEADDSFLSEENGTALLRY